MTMPESVRVYEHIQCCTVITPMSVFSIVLECSFILIGTLAS